MIRNKLKNIFFVYYGQINKDKNLLESLCNYINKIIMSDVNYNTYHNENFAEELRLIVDNFNEKNKIKLILKLESLQTASSSLDNSIYYEFTYSLNQKKCENIRLRYSVHFFKDLNHYTRSYSKPFYYLDLLQVNDNYVTTISNWELGRDKKYLDTINFSLLKLFVSNEKL